MIQIQLKAKHFYFIAFYLKDRSILQYYKLVNRIKSQLEGNTDNEGLFMIDVYPYEVIDIFNMLTKLPEGLATTINTEMLQLLQPQIISGVTNEMQSGILPDSSYNLPENAYWQCLAQGIQAGRLENFKLADYAIEQGKILIEQL